jgi:hypothetical protein
MRIVHEVYGEAQVTVGSTVPPHEGKLAGFRVNVTAIIPPLEGEILDAIHIDGDAAHIRSMAIQIIRAIDATASSMGDDLADDWAGNRDAATAIVPAGVRREFAVACPTDQLRPWLALLTPWIDDAGSPNAWSGHARRYAAVVAEVGRWDETTWRRAHLGVLAAIVRSCRDHAPEACDPVLVLLDEGAPAEDPRWVAAASAAAAEAEAEAEVAAWVAAWVAEAATAWEAEAEAEDTASAAEAAASKSSADRIIDGILTALEIEMAS